MLRCFKSGENQSYSFDRRPSIGRLCWYSRNAGDQLRKWLTLPMISLAGSGPNEMLKLIKKRGKLELRSEKDKFLFAKQIKGYQKKRRRRNGSKHTNRLLPRYIGHFGYRPGWLYLPPLVGGYMVVTFTLYPFLWLPVTGYRWMVTTRCIGTRMLP